MAKVRNHCFRARKPPNLPKVGVAKHIVGGANLEVGGAAAPPTVWKTPPVVHEGRNQISLDEALNQQDNNRITDQIIPG